MKLLSTFLALACAPLLPLPATAAAGAPCASAPSEDPAALVARGRRQLAEGELAAARALFEQAAELDRSPGGPRAWLVRALIAEGRVNDALDQAEALAEEGLEGPLLDYLFGMAFATKALGYMRDGTGGSVLEMAFGDAVQYLDSATRAEPERFADAWPLLADCAWQVQRLELARTASEHALEARPDDVEAALRLARVAIAQFVADNGAGDADAQARADAAWERAVEVLRAALERSATPAQRARVGTELGHALVWKQALDEAAQAYAAAIAEDPAQFNYMTVSGLLDAPRLVEVCTRAAETRAARGESVDPTLAWWRGWALASAGRWQPAEEAFLESVRLRPDFTNSWYWVLYARERGGRQAEAVALLRQRLADEGDDMRLVLAQNGEAALALLDRLVAWSVEQGDLALATELSLVQTQVEPSEPRYWNNVGLFRRDAGEALARAAKDDPDARARAQELYQGALEAYRSALALAPDDPALLNDTAVILHYYLQRELDEAERLYARALESAERELAREDLDPARRELYATAKRDARTNLDKLAQERAPKVPGS